MRYTPVELRHVTPGRTLFGYKRAEVDQIIEDTVESFEEVWRERGELADKLEDLERSFDEVKVRETLLASTLVAAEKTAAEAIEAAKREAEVIIAEAHHESRSITRAAQSERERLFVEVRRIETLLRAALGMVEESKVGATPATEEEPPPSSSQRSWPNRQDTREFQAITPAPAPAPPPEPSASQPTQLPPVQEISEEEDDEGPWAARDFAWG